VSNWLLDPCSRLASGTGGSTLPPRPLTYELRPQIGREVTENDPLRILEFKTIYQWAIDRARSATSA
jgi:hypothetical protein